MAPTRSNNLEQTVRWFHALSDETRLHILDRLSQGEQCVCDLTDFLETGQSRLSFHLKTLKEAGLIEDRREGRWVYYRVNDEAMGEIGRWLDSFKAHRRNAGPSSPRCG